MLRGACAPAGAEAGACRLLLWCLLLGPGLGAPRTHARASTAALPPIAVPSPEFPSVAAVLAPARGGDAVGRTVVVGDGRHDLGPGVGTLALGQPLRLRAANSPAPGGEWKARLRGCDVPQYSSGCPPVPLPTSAPRPATPIAIP